MFARDFNPADYLILGNGSSTDAGEYFIPMMVVKGRCNWVAEPMKFAKTNKLDVVMFCGSPGAGKSTFYWRNLQPLGYERVNQDILKTVSVTCRVFRSCL